MLEAIRVSTVLAAPPERIYHAWLDGTEHTAFTGGRATCEPHVGGRLTAWDGYIEGKLLELHPGRRIVQSWRSSEFPEGHADSHLDITLEPADGGTRVTLHHTSIPEGQSQMYEEGWRDHYFTPMAEYFRGKSAPATAPAAAALGGHEDDDDDGDGVEDELRLVPPPKAAADDWSVDSIPPLDKVPAPGADLDWSLDTPTHPGDSHAAPKPKAAAKPKAATAPKPKTAVAAKAAVPVKAAAAKPKVSAAAKKKPVAAKKAPAKKPAKKALAAKKKAPKKPAAKKPTAKKPTGKKPAAKKAAGKKPAAKKPAKGKAKKRR